MRSFAAFALAILAFATPAYAMTVQPSVIDMTATGRSAKAAIEVVNTGTKPLPVEFEISRLELDVNGGRKQTPSNGDFLVFPPQAIVKPGATQVFRVQWTGEPDLKTGRSYVFSVNQLPVKTKDAKSGIDIVFNFGVIVSVAPQNGTSSIRQVRVESASDEGGVKRPAVTVENQGTAHAYLSNATIVLESGSWQRSLSGAEVRQTMGLGLIQPGKQRRFILPVDLPAAASQVSARIVYKPKSSE
jgi:P pilus assembly chaperone PapD